MFFIKSFPELYPIIFIFYYLITIYCIFCKKRAADQPLQFAVPICVIIFQVNQTVEIGVQVAGEAPGFELLDGCVEALQKE